MNYLTYIFEKLNMFNKQLHASYKTLLDAKTKIFGFATFIEVCKKNIFHKTFDRFHWQKM